MALNYMPFLSKPWTHKYPRGHFLLTALFYQPLVSHWRAHPERVNTADGRVVLTPFTQARLVRLARLSRKIGVVMSVLAVLATVLIGKVLFEDFRAALLAGLTLALSGLFVFYASSGCLEMPTMFWVSWATLFALLVVRTGRWYYYVLLGFFSAYAVGSKEGVVAYVAGLWLAAAWLFIYERRRQGLSVGAAIKGLCTAKMLAAILTALVVFLSLQGFWAGPGEFLERIRHWQQVRQDEFISGFAGYGWLTKRIAYHFYLGLGWPILLGAVLSLLWALRRFSAKLLFLLLPLLAFLAMTYLSIKFVAPRFLMCGYIGLSLLVGKGLSDWLQAKRIGRAGKIAAPLVVFLPSLLFCVGLDLEMLGDSRADAEAWITDHVRTNQTIGAAMSRSSGLRSGYQGYRTVYNWHSQGVPTQQGLVKVLPDYLVISPDWTNLPNPRDPAFHRQLRQGQAGYQKAAVFDRRFLTDRSKFWGLAIWPESDQYPRLSPRIEIYRKTAATP